MPVRVRMRWTAYAGASTALAAGVILKALAQRPNFYSAAVYLSQSSANLMILTNLLFVVACTFLIGLQKLLYGSLRPIEIEQLYEKAWFAVTETCLAMTVFRGEVGLSFLAMFFALLTGKVWGWIGEGRVEVLEQQPPRNPRLFHTRLALSLGLSVAFDLTMLEYVVKQVMRMARPDMMVMFGFEFAVLSVMSISTAMRYAIDLVEIGIVREQKRLRIEEIRRERVQAAISEFQEAQNANGQVAATSGQAEASAIPTPTQRTLEQVSEEAFNQPVDENEVEVEGWEDKGRYMFYLNLATDFFKLVIYLAFFFILLVFYGLPIHILRDVFLTMRSFLKRISDFMKYRAATRDMNERYPDATEEDIGREDVCIICREEMRPYQPPVAEAGQPRPRGTPVAERMRPKKLPCGHVLHFSCLRSWLERQQICPTCRANVVRAGRTGGGPGGAGQAGAGQGEDGQAPPGGRQGPRVYQFGPLRIGVGAVRGNNMLEELQQQLEEVRRGPAPAPAAAQMNGDANAPRQLGVGVRWAGPRRQQVGEHDMTTQEQLDALRGQLDREMQELAHNSAELGVLQSMQAEMQRLRNLRPGETMNQTIPNSQGPASGPAPPPQNPAPSQLPRTTQVLSGNDRHEVIYAGSDRLPPGLTLPEGWCIMPLRSTTLDTIQPAPPSAIRNLMAGLDEMQRLQAYHRSVASPAVSHQHHTALNGAGQGQTTTFQVRPNGSQGHPQHVPNFQELVHNHDQHPSRPSNASTNVNGAGNQPRAPGIVPTSPVILSVPPVVGYQPLGTIIQVPVHEHLPVPPPTQQGSTRPVLPAWGSDTLGDRENRPSQTLNGGSNTGPADHDQGSPRPSEDGAISSAPLENSGRDAPRDENEGEANGPTSSHGNGAPPEHSAETSSGGQSAAKDRHATVEDLVEDPD